MLTYLDFPLEHLSIPDPQIGRQLEVKRLIQETLDKKERSHRI